MVLCFTLVLFRFVYVFVSFVVSPSITFTPEGRSDDLLLWHLHRAVSPRLAWIIKTKWIAKVPSPPWVGLPTFYYAIRTKRWLHIWHLDLEMDIVTRGEGPQIPRVYIETPVLFYRLSATETGKRIPQTRKEKEGTSEKSKTFARGCKRHFEQTHCSKKRQANSSKVEVPKPEKNYKFAFFDHKTIKD